MGKLKPPVSSFEFLLARQATDLAAPNGSDREARNLKLETRNAELGTRFGFSCLLEVIFELVRVLPLSNDDLQLSRQPFQFSGT